MWVGRERCSEREKKASVQLKQKLADFFVVVHSKREEGKKEGVISRSI